MTKIYSTLIAAVMMAAGLVAFGTGPANAACPYSGCVPTKTAIEAPGKVVSGSRAKICVRVSTDGNGQPKGTVSVKVARNNGGFSFSDAKKYDSSKACFTTPKLKKKGKYSIAAHFVKKPGSRWKNSSDSDNFRVVRRR